MQLLHPTIVSLLQDNSCNLSLLGIKYPPRPKFIKDRSFGALLAPDLVCGASPNSLDRPDFFDDGPQCSPIGPLQRPSEPRY